MSKRHDGEKTADAQAMDREEERALVRAAQDGDDGALEQLLATHQDRVYRTALRLLGGREEPAFELAQEVLISAYRHIHQFRSEARLSTWLYRITTNLAKNRFVVENRERARFRSLDTTASDDPDARTPQFADNAVDARTLAGDRETMAILHERLDTLDPEWREVIVLRYFEDMSYDAIGQALSLPLGTVKSRINRARKALREAMQDVLEERQTT